MVADRSIYLSEVSAAEKDCRLCALLLRTAKRHGNDELNVQIVRERSTLKIGSKGPRILQLCSDSEYSVGPDNYIRIGFPLFPETESPARFALLRAWLRWCSKSHDCGKHDARSNGALPARLLYVGHIDDPGYDPDILRLDLATQIAGGKYIALSHCWGNLPIEDKKQFCTTRENIDRRREGFSISELPKTFQDAVKVTRELRATHLWIDSLCIIQYDDEDWKRESGRMEDVFSLAYCTIAATSAVDSRAGFLERNVSSEYVYVQDASGRRFYVCADIDDFDNDVEKAQLNTRAWVMQERVLSRRTIHFSANQAYFECGEGVYCETLTRLECSLRKKFFTLDSSFPDRLMELGYKRTIEFIHFISAEYSKCDLSVKTDRYVAMSGLEARIARAIGCQSRYGIFQQYLHRNLLWQTSDNKMERIMYKTVHVPSWSWMAYNGGIQFMEIPFGSAGYHTVDWISNLEFDKGRELALIADVGKLRDCTMEPHGKHYAVLDSGKVKRGWIQYDVVEDGEDLCKEQCVVVVGRTSSKGKDKIKDEDSLDVEEYYILVVRPTGVDGDYSRAGVGLIQSDYVMRQRLNVRVV